MIGLQDVDGLKPSEHLYETAKKNIDGEISVYEAGDLINSYYESKDGRTEVETRTEEADKVSARIVKILSEKAFTFSSTQYLSIHRELFLGIYSHAGKIRDYNITKKEWVLDGDAVSYGGATELRETLNYDFSQERDFRNALVRANYNNIKNGIYETTEFLEMFLRNLLLNEKHELHNREMHVSGKFFLGHDDSINDPINDPIKLDGRELKIIELLREETGLTRKEMVARLDCSD